MASCCEVFKDFIIIPSVRKLKHFDIALNCPAPILLLSEVHIGNLMALVKRCHEKKKLVFVDVELVGGFAPDHIGLKLMKDMFKVDGIVSSNSMCINFSKTIDLFTIQRFFLRDSRSFDSGLKTLKTSKSDAVEVLPGPLSTKFKDEIRLVKDVPLLGGGFVNNKKIVYEIYKAGFKGVTASEERLWNDYSYLK